MTEQSTEQIQPDHQAGPPACPTPTKSGAPCKGTPTSTGRCVSHSPEHATLMGQARRKGGQLVQARRALQRAHEQALDSLGVSEELPDLADMERMQKYLVTVARRVESRTLSPAQGNTLVAIARLAKDCVSLATEIELLHQLEAQREENPLAAQRKRFTR